MRRFTGLFCLPAAVFLIAALNACSKEEVDASYTDSDEVEILAPAASVEVNSSLQLATKAAASSGGPIPPDSVAWQSNATDIATVNKLGLVTGHKQGTAVITATVNGKTATKEIVVNPLAENPVATLELNAASKMLQSGEEFQLYVTAFDDENVPILKFTPQWQSDNPEVATVDSDGLVLAKSKGAVTITATVDQAAAECKVQVLADILEN